MVYARQAAANLFNIGKRNITCTERFSLCSSAEFFMPAVQPRHLFDILGHCLTSTAPTRPIRPSIMNRKWRRFERHSVVADLYFGMEGCSYFIHWPDLTDVLRSAPFSLHDRPGNMNKTGARHEALIHTPPTYRPVSSLAVTPDWLRAAAGHRSPQIT